MTVEPKRPRGRPRKDYVPDGSAATASDGASKEGNSSEGSISAGGNEEKSGAIAAVPGAVQGMQSAASILTATLARASIPARPPVPPAPPKAAPPTASTGVFPPAPPSSLGGAQVGAAAKDSKASGSKVSGAKRPLNAM
jgi:hypothetical protein